jgi:hypothetical protein
VSNDILYDGNHELWRLVQWLVNQEPPRPMAIVAAELGVETKALCEWMLRYKSPPKPTYMVRTGAPARSTGWSTIASEQRYQNWKKARDGAAAARRSVA